MQNAHIFLEINWDLSLENLHGKVWNWNSYFSWLEDAELYTHWTKEVYVTKRI